MSEVRIFESRAFGEVRAIARDGEPWFVAADVCRALDISNNRDAVKRLDEDEKDVASTDTLGGRQEAQIVSESGLYSLVLGSRKPEARAFKRWITHEVIPDIRRHGMYAAADTAEALLADPDMMVRTLTAYRAEKQRRMALEAQAEKDRVKVLFADSVAASRQSILIGELARLIRQNGVPIGQNRLFRWLRQEGFLCVSGERYNLPTQRAMEMGLFEVAVRTVCLLSVAVRPEAAEAAAQKAIHAGTAEAAAPKTIQSGAAGPHSINRRSEMPVRPTPARVLAARATNGYLCPDCFRDPCQRHTGVRLVRTTRCTGRGQVYFINRFLNEWRDAVPARGKKQGQAEAGRPV